jgi:hypothetical protein
MKKSREVGILVIGRKGGKEGDHDLKRLCHLLTMDQVLDEGDPMQTIEQMNTNLGRGVPGDETTPETTTVVVQGETLKELLDLSLQTLKCRIYEVL